MEYAYQNSTIAQILEAIINESTFEGESNSNIGDILLSILNKTPYTEPPKSVIADLLLRVKAKIEGESFDPYEGDHISRIADILISILEETEYTEAPQSRIAELLLELKEELEAYTELTASGAIASFITNVVKPLVNGEFTIQAYQEGSGDPSPVNVRNIIGYNALNMTKTGKNIKPNEGDNDTYQGVEVTYSPIDDTYTLNGTALSATMVALKVFSKIHWKIETYYTISVTVISGDFVIPSGTGNTYAVTIGNNQFTRIIRGATSNTADKLNGYKGSGLSFDSNAYRLVFQVFRAGMVFNNLKIKIQIEEGREATAYEPYVTPEVKTKQLGETVYGGSYNIDGTKRKTYAKYIFDGSVEPSVVNWRPQDNSVGFYWNDIFTFNSPPNIYIPANVICDKLTTVPYGDLYSNDIDSIAFLKVGEIYRVLIRIKDTTLTTREAVVDYLTHNPITIVYETENAIESNIGATPISTNIGDNNIFCDTGDTSVTYLYKGTPPETVTRLLSKGSSENNDIMKEEKLEDLKDLDKLQDLDISDKEAFYG